MIYPHQKHQSITTQSITTHMLRHPLTKLCSDGPGAASVHRDGDKLLTTALDKGGHSSVIVFELQNIDSAQDDHKMLATYYLLKDLLASVGMEMWFTVQIRMCRWQLVNASNRWPRRADNVYLDPGFTIRVRGDAASLWADVLRPTQAVAPVSVTPQRQVAPLNRLGLARFRRDKSGAVYVDFEGNTLMKLLLDNVRENTTIVFELQIDPSQGEHTLAKNFSMLKDLLAVMGLDLKFAMKDISKCRWHLGGMFLHTGIIVRVKGNLVAPLTEAMAPAPQPRPQPGIIKVIAAPMPARLSAAAAAPAPMAKAAAAAPAPKATAAAPQAHRPARLLAATAAPVTMAKAAAAAPAHMHVRLTSAAAITAAMPSDGEAAAAVVDEGEDEDEDEDEELDFAHLYQLCVQR